MENTRRTYRIAVVPGDGIGKETVPEGLRVLDAAARRFGFDLKLTHYDWSCETYKETGRMMPEDGLDRLRDSDSIFLGAVGWPGVPDHVSLWGLLIPIRRVFDQYVSLRPCRLMPGMRTPLADRTPAEIDFYVVRENTEGEYSAVGGRMFEGTEREFVSQQSVLTRHGTDRILRYAFELAMTRPRKKVTSATKSNGITFTMPYWDERFTAMAKHYPEVTTDQFHIDIPCARISCSTRTGSTWWWAPTSSATSCRTSAPRWRAASASRPPPTSTRRRPRPPCLSRCTAARRTSLVRASATPSARSGQAR
jgi:tartrate dehydrogenase/decarboxylase / D-malate dehydrogenase